MKGSQQKDECVERFQVILHVIETSEGCLVSGEYLETSGDMHEKSTAWCIYKDTNQPCLLNPSFCLDSYI